MQVFLWGEAPGNWACSSNYLVCHMWRSIKRIHFYPLDSQVVLSSWMVMLAGKIHKLACRVGLVAPRIPKSNGFSDEMPGEQNRQGAQSPDAAACQRQDLFLSKKKDDFYFQVCLLTLTMNSVTSWFFYDDNHLFFAQFSIWSAWSDLVLTLIIWHTI